MLGVVIDKLSVDENIGLKRKNFVDFCLHLSLFCLFDFSNLLHRVDLNLRAHNLDLVVVHGGVGDHDARVAR